MSWAPSSWPCFLYLLCPPSQTEPFLFLQDVDAQVIVGGGQDWLRPLDSNPLWYFCLLRRETEKKSPTGMVSQAQHTPRRGCPQSVHYQRYRSSARDLSQLCGLGPSRMAWSHASPAAPGCISRVEALSVPAELTMIQVVQAPGPALPLFLSPCPLGLQVQDHKKALSTHHSDGSKAHPLWPTWPQTERAQLGMGSGTCFGFPEKEAWFSPQPGLELT